MLREIDLIFNQIGCKKKCISPSIAFSSEVDANMMDSFSFAVMIYYPQRHEPFIVLDYKKIDIIY